jgi:Peptidase C39 family
LTELDRADREPALVSEVRVTRLKEKMAAAIAHVQKLHAIGGQLQKAVETKHHLIVAHDVTNSGHDHHLLHKMATAACEALGTEALTEAAECGLACPAMVASFHGYRTDLASLRQKHAISLKGTNLKHLMAIASRLHLRPRAVKLELEHLDKLALPAILHWDMNHFVVLTEVRKKTLVVHDQREGGGC